MPEFLEAWRYPEDAEQPAHFPPPTEDTSIAVRYR